METLFSLIESRTHPFLGPVYQQLNIQETRFNSSRKLIKQLKTQQPDYIAAEFFYGYGNNYAGVNVSNLDVMLYSLQRYSNETRIIVFVDKQEQQYVKKLEHIMPIHAAFTQPIKPQEIEAFFKNTL